MAARNTINKQSQNNIGKTSPRPYETTDKKQNDNSVAASEENGVKKTAKNAKEKKVSAKKTLSDKKVSAEKSSAENKTSAVRFDTDEKSLVSKTASKTKNKSISKENTDFPQSEIKNLHEGHRQRVKQRFLKHGLDSFTDVQFLETLLFYAVPKKDTNETAHLLLNKFGSVRKVFAASYEDLIKVNGVGDNAASLIKFFQMGAKKYMELSFEDEDEVLVNNPEKLMDYCQGLFLGMKKEAVYVIALDADLAIINAEQLCSGETDKVWISFRTLADFVYRNSCTRIAIAHNHPGGIEMPSRYDMAATEEIAEFLDQIEVELVDHVIVGKGGALSLRKEHRELSFWKKDYSFIY